MRSLWTPRWALVHAGVVVLVAAFLLLGWWQAGRAASGNLLSYGYAFQWPAFAVFTVYVWVKEMRRTRLPADAGPLAHRTVAESATVAQSLAVPVPSAARRRTLPRTDPAAAGYADHDDPELAAYNHYLAWLNDNPSASPSDYPGTS